MGVLHKSHLLPAALWQNCACVAGSEHFSPFLSAWRGHSSLEVNIRGQGFASCFFREKGNSSPLGVLDTISWSHCSAIWQIMRQFNVSMLDEKCVCLRKGCSPHPWFCRERTPVIISQEPAVSMESTPCSPSCCWRAACCLKPEYFQLEDIRR